jgi:hypothetical protein
MAGALAPSAVPYTDDEDVNAVITADGTTLTEAAKEWIKDYDQAAEARWQASGAQAEDDIWRFKADVLINRFLPYGGRVADLTPGLISRTEYCYPQLITVGCWLYQRDDRSTPSQMSSVRTLGDGWEGYGWRYQETPEVTGYGAQGIMDMDSFLALYHYGCCDFIDVTAGHQGSFCNFPGDPDIAGVWVWKLTGGTRSCALNGQPVQAPKGYYSYSAIQRDKTILRPQADDPGIVNNQGCRNSGGCWAPPADWADKIAQELKKPANGRIRDWIAHDIGAADDPYDYSGRLYEYVPYLSYDRNTKYFADSAATITDNLPNTLHRYTDGELLAYNRPLLPDDHPLREAPELDLNFLQPSVYARGGKQALEVDRLDEFEQSRVIDSSVMHNQVGSQYPNRAYGRIATDSAGGIWLQYWLFYYYNEQNLAGIGEHEGDWEMVQYHISPEGRPDEATYAQHTDDDAESCPWGQVDKILGVPVVYVARDSNASYFWRGTHPHTPDDVANGDGDLIRPVIEVLTNYNWVLWPGRWGNSDGAVQSPRSPSKQGPKWDDPFAFNNQAGPCTTPPG